MRTFRPALSAWIGLCAYFHSPVALSESASPLRITERFQLPMVELSALGQSEETLFAASDREHDLWQLPLDSTKGGEPQLDSRSSIALELNIPSSQQAQWEAIAVSSKEGVFLAKETGSEVYHYNAGGQLLSTYKLGAWSGRKNPDRGFEGLLLLNKGHFLIALEAEPSALIEYGPKGDSPVGLAKGAKVKANEFEPGAVTELVPLAAWTIKSSLGSCEFSDLAEAPEGGFFILMKGCMKVARIDELKVDETKFSVREVYGVPSEVYHPEGLQVLSGGDFLIGTDIKEKSTNLYRLAR